MTTVPFSGLIPGENINARTSARDEGIEKLAATIMAKGILQPLAVRAVGDRAEVIDGNRRYAALKLLVEKGLYAADREIPVHYRDDESDADARESSLLANIERLQLHPIDQFEEFQRLHETWTIREIAYRFGITERLVAQRIALGNLHPDIRDAWRKGEIAEDSARAFTLADDQKRQLKVFKDLQKKNWLYSHQIKTALGVDHDVNTAIGIVGADAYRAAGGKITEDLFGKDVSVSDPDLAKAMLADSIQKTCEGLVADGWSFAKTKGEVSNPWQWTTLKPSGKAAPTEEEKAELERIDPRLKQLSEAGEEDEGLPPNEEAEFAVLEIRREAIEAAIELRRWGAKQKAKAGCFVDVQSNAIRITYGVQSPQAAKKAAKAGADDKGGKDAREEKPAISNALTLEL